MGKGRLDKYGRLAKEHGFRSRAAWKLIQLDSKFRFLRKSRSVLDLCAAPGGWLQVAVDRLPVGSLVIGLDLDPIRPIHGAVTVQVDITSPVCKATVRKVMAEHKGSGVIDLILHDGLPNVDVATTQIFLVAHALRIVAVLLAPGGTFVTKVFSSSPHYGLVMYTLTQLFEKVKVYKPTASWPSFETYVIGLKYKAPARINPRLLDLNYALKVKDMLEYLREQNLPPATTRQILWAKGDTTLRESSSATDFVWSNAPVDILASASGITFEDTASLAIKVHTLTTEEVRALCDNLLVLGKEDFKYLLKWRMNMRKALTPTPNDTSTSEIHNVPKENEDEKVLIELEELMNAMDQKKKKAKKLVANRWTKDSAQNALGMQQDAIGKGYVDLETFSLSSIKGKKMKTK